MLECILYLLLINIDSHTQINKTLNAVLSLQEHWDGVLDAIQTATQTFEHSKPQKKTLDMLQAIKNSHEKSSSTLESLYASLNGPGPGQKVAGASLQFNQALQLAHDLKITIRRKAIDSFFEWDRLDQAVGGRNMALGKDPSSQIV